VGNSDEISWVGAVFSPDMHGKIYQGKVSQTFGNGKSKIRVDKNTFLYAERSFKGDNLNVGDPVWVQAHSISSLEIEDKDYKGTLNVALVCGPIILYPFETGIHISHRLKQYPEFAHSLKQHFEPFAGRFGIKFRLSSKDYSFLVLERLIKWVKYIWDSEQYNHVGFRILNEILHFFLEPSTVYSNDSELTEWLLKSIETIFSVEYVSRKSLPSDQEFLEDAWDCACRKKIPLIDEASMVIEETHACTVIDVNAGASVSYERVNLEAIYALPKILLQGKFGGKIIVDLLPFKNREESEYLLKRFTAEWQVLEVSAQVFGISKMGLLEFILPRKGLPLWWLDKKIIKN
jgi:hypothetical protein